MSPTTASIPPVEVGRRVSPYSGYVPWPNHFLDLSLPRARSAVQTSSFIDPGFILVPPTTLCSPTLSSPTMYGNEDYIQNPRLYFDDRSSDQDTGHDFYSQFQDGALSDPFAQYGRRQHHPDGTQGRLGLGPPPSIPRIPAGRSASLNPPPTTGRGYNPRAPSLQFPDRGIAANPQDLVAMLAGISLRQDQIFEETQQLKRDTGTLQARVTSFEQRPPPVVVAAQMSNPDPRLAAATQKKQVTRRGRKERGVQSVPAVSQLLELDASTPGHSTPLGATEPQRAGVYLGDRSLPPGALLAQTATQKFVSKMFRDVCGVGPKQEWPDPNLRRVNDITGEVYLTPRFNGLCKNIQAEYGFLLTEPARSSSQLMRSIYLTLN
ncbi:hypothetical protein B0H16DRAFT_1781606 [Mycena metata]|uniref:Uncharacterized protein n=1 Tax=Mycena metata TaxID=1033252 RepID=A0AAD7MP71_9AGAR|nr:hypothetical protein B0H16DRAFT_1781606 [Mycena metata]